jgi:hypothetical protein
MTRLTNKVDANVLVQGRFEHHQTPQPLEAQKEERVGFWSYNELRLACNWDCTMQHAPELGTCAPVPAILTKGANVV